MWVSSAEGQKLFQHQHWVYTLHHTVVFLVILGHLQLYLKDLSTGNNYYLHWLKNKWKKLQKTEKIASASLQLGFPLWDPVQISKLLQYSPFRGRQLGKQRTVLLGRQERERRMKSRILFLLPSCSWRIRSERTCILSDSPQLIPSREIIQTSHSCEMNHLSFLSALVAHPVRPPGPSTISLSSSSAWRLYTHKTWWVVWPGSPK